VSETNRVAAVLGGGRVLRQGKADVSRPGMSSFFIAFPFLARRRVAASLARRVRPAQGGCPETRRL